MTTSRSAVAVAVAGVLLASLSAAALAPAAQAQTPVGGTEVWNILPPGQSGTIDAVEFARVLATDPDGRVAVDGYNAPPNFADQLERYDALNTIDPYSITMSDLDTYYKRASIEVRPGEVAQLRRRQRRHRGRAALRPVRRCGHCGRDALPS